MEKPFETVDAGRGVRILYAVAQVQEDVAATLASMIKSQTNLHAFDHSITPCGQRFMITVITQQTKK